VLVDNDSTDPATLTYLEDLSANPRFRVIPFRGPFNYSSINNVAARRALGEVLSFLNNDTLVLTKDWWVELWHMRFAKTSAR
jgi:O-antigen biosynthesis protein